MQVTIEIPDAVVARLKLNGRSVSRELLEAFAVEGYGTGQRSFRVVMSANCWA